MNTGTEDQQSIEQAGQEKGRPTQDLGQFLTEEYAVVEPRYGDLCKGVIITVEESGLLVDFGFKREGFVPADDLEHLDEETRSSISPGAEVPVFVVRARTRDGLPTLSIQQAQQYEHWLKAEEMLASNELYEGEVAGCNRGGLIVRFGDIRGFVPTSQVVGMPRRLPDDERRRRLEAMVGRRIGLRVIEVDRGRRRLIFSQRRAYREWQERRRQQTMAELTEGEVRKGIVTDLTSFGAFVDLGGADGLVHVSELSWRRVNHPREVVRSGQEVEVYVLGVDRQRKRIALSLKRLQPDPWTVVDDEYRVGQLVNGRVTRVLDFGAFVELDTGIEGLLHVSEMIGTPELQPADVVRPKDQIVLKVIRIDSGRKRIGLSAKQVRQNEWERWMVEQLNEEAAEAEAEAESAEAESAEAEAPEPSDAEPVDEVLEAEQPPAAQPEPSADAPPETDERPQEVAEPAAGEAGAEAEGGGAGIAPDAPQADSPGEEPSESEAEAAEREPGAAQEAGAPEGAEPLPEPPGAGAGDEPAADGAAPEVA
jgi:small subunit ribosomal protein S1